ncbi:MAG: hypothetical protein C0616_15500 [Desulfuromonas sp.]|nr:MAG: hypothetical protein C0616_15500 [Desulfuromonas sp.]
MNQAGLQPIHVGKIGFGRRFSESLLGMGWYGFCCQKPVQIMTWCSPVEEDLERILHCSEFGLWLPYLYPKEGADKVSVSEDWPFLIACRQERSSPRGGRLLLHGRVERIWRRGSRVSLSVLEAVCQNWGRAD